MRILACVAAAAMLIAGCARPGAEASHHASGADGLPPASGPSDVDNALAQVLAGLDATAFRSATVGEAPTPDMKHGPWLYVEANPHGPLNQDQLRNLWEADLASAAVAQLNVGPEAKTLSDGLTGSVVTQLDRMGDPLDVETVATTNMPPGTTYDQISDNSVVEFATKTLANFGMTPVDVRVLHPLQSALYVVAEVPSEELVARTGALLVALRGDGTRFEGIYLELRDRSGQALVAEGAAARAESGRLWTEPSLKVDTGIPHGSGAGGADAGEPSMTP